MNKIIASLTFVCLSLVFAKTSFAQAYRIDVNLGNSERPDLYLGYYLNGKTYVQDSAESLGNGIYSFQGTESLKKGMYFLANGSTLLIDLLVGEDQAFELKALNEDFTEVEVVGDEENELFFENMKFNLERKKEGAPFVQVMRDSTASVAEKEAAQEKVNAINQRVAEHQERIITEFPSSMLATLFKSGKQIVIPNELANATDQGAQLRKLYYYRNHYWDFFDLGDPILMRLPRSFYKEKVDDFLDNLTIPNQDSIKLAVDQLIEQASKEEETYQYLVWHLTTKYQSSKIMGMDEVYVHLVDKYFETGEMDFWANEQLKKNLREKAEQYRNSLIGMVAPNLVLQDPSSQPKALHDVVNDYCVIYFYDPDCGHCKKETPVLKEFSESSPFDVGVYSVSADTSMTKMTDYIEKMGLESWTNTNGTRTYGINYQEVYDAYTTPTIYLLNEKKEIIAKKIAASQLAEVIENYERFVKQ